MNEHNPKIYLLPNLMTAGNLFCGFAATLKIVQGALIQWSNPDAAADFTPPSGSFSALAFSMCSTAASRAWEDKTAPLAGNSIPSPILSRLVLPPR
jgi:CDP-diacylglycerol---serine O-phosphatidyltransferase